MIDDRGIRPASAGQYAGAFEALKPVGVVWPRGPDAAQGKVSAALAEEFQRLDARVYQLALESAPSGALELLADWERAVGLPDPCADPPDPAATKERRDLVLARLAALGGASPAFFEALALAIGWQVKVERCPVPVAGLAECGVARLYPHRLGPPPEIVGGPADIRLVEGGPADGEERLLEGGAIDGEFRELSFGIDTAALPTQAAAAYPFYWIAEVLTPVGGELAEAGVAEAGITALGNYDIARLQCVFGAAQPAHTKTVWIVQEV